MSDPLIHGGYVMIARQVRKSPLWLSLKCAHRMVMMEILLQAQWQDGEVVRNGEIIPLKRGQVATSYQQLVDDIADKDVTIKIVRTAIDKMERSQFLAKDEAVQRAKKGLLLTVVKYDFFQSPDNYKGRVEDSEKDKAKAEQGQSKGRVRAINNKVNKVEEIKYIKIKDEQYQEELKKLKDSSSIDDRLSNLVRLSGKIFHVKGENFHAQSARTRQEFEGFVKEAKSVSDQDMRTMYLLTAMKNAEQHMPPWDIVKEARKRVV